MKFNPVQSDFSAGEIAPRAQGHVEADIYKAGLARVANYVPSRQGSIGSRAGARLVSEDPVGNSAFRGSKVRVVGFGGDPTRTSIGDMAQPLDTMVLEISQAGYIRVLNRTGPMPWEYPFDVSVSKWTLQQPTSKVGTPWVDVAEEKIYLQNRTGDADARRAMLDLNTGVGPAASAAATFYVEFEVAGLPVHFQCEKVASPFTVYWNNTYSAGKHSISFSVASDSNVVRLMFEQLGSQTGTSCVSNIKVRRENTAFSSLYLADIAAVQDLNKLSVTSFTDANNYTFIVICGTGITLPYVLVNRPPTITAGAAPQVITRGAGWAWWELRQMRFDGAAAPAWSQLITCAVAYQDRLWLALNDGVGTIRASEVGYGGLSLATAGYVNFVFALPAATVPPTVQKATAPMSLRLASPSGRVMWFAVLRGLLLGTTRRELTFSQQEALALDPAAGLIFDVVEHSALGSADLAAVPVNDKVVFAEPGRQLLRMAGIRFDSQGGLVADDISVLGEHLLRARVRSMCFIKAPTPRLVFAFDDGTGAVATLGGKAPLAWARLTFAAPFDRLYSVAAVNAQTGSELWLSFENGSILRIDDLDSYPVEKTRYYPGAANSETVAERFDVDFTYWPPVMDGYIRTALSVSTGSGPYAAGIAQVRALPASYVGKTVHVFFNSRYIGTKVVDVDGTGGAISFNDDDGSDIDITMVDSAGHIIAGEVTLGLAFPEHKFKLLPLEGGNPAGTAQGLLKRRVRFWLRFVESFMPLVDGERVAPQEQEPLLDALPARVTDDVRVQGLGWTRGAQSEVSQDLPLRVEVSAVFGDTAVNGG